MIKRITPVVLLICLLAVIVGPGPVRAGSELALLSSSAEMDFPMRMVFDISAESNDIINDIRLSYVVNRLEHTRIVSEIYIQFPPASSVTAQWVWDMRKTGGLPPGSSVDYWWTISDTNGSKLTTEPARIYIEDDRYDWQHVTEGDVTLYWYRGNDSFASELMAATQEALTRLSDNTGAEVEDMVSIYIYANSEDLRGSMIFPQEWTGGVAFTRYGIIAIGIEPSTGGVEWGRRVISHELTHLVIHRVTFSPYSGLPTWLDEGLAMTSEGELSPQFLSVLDVASKNDELITVRSLASPFSAYADESLLSYAQSYKIVEYLIDEYGREKMFELLSTFAEGSGYDKALEKVYGFDMDGLNDLWLDYFLN
jgi:hypothetical protein